MSISKETLRLFWRYPEDDGPKMAERMHKDDVGPYLFFRRSKTQIQERLSQLMDHENIPQVFLHGSPHLDNYAKTHFGGGMVDYDRAYYGPFIWDLVCVMLAISLRSPVTFDKFICKKTVEQLREGYLLTWHKPEKHYVEYAPLIDCPVKEWQENTKAYLNSNKKWAKQLHKNAIDIDDPIANECLRQFVDHLENHHLLDNYSVDTIARCAGSFGRPRYLYALMPKHDSEDAILLDIKHTRNYQIAAWPHTKYYHSPFDHQGKRMIAAANLYTPQLTVKESYATVNGVEYWGRQVPTLNRKPDKVITQQQQQDFAISAGMQLGRGHRLTLHHITPDEFMDFFNNNFDNVVAVTKQIQRELMYCWRAVCNKTT